MPAKLRSFVSNQISTNLRVLESLESNMLEAFPLLFFIKPLNYKVAEFKVSAHKLINIAYML